MAAYEVLLLNTAIPQIQAAQAGDTYVVPRDIAINATAIISANSATDALRITQTGAGNAILVEDSANPDSTPFVVTAAGNVGIGTTNPLYKLHVNGNIYASAIEIGEASAFLSNSPDALIGWASSFSGYTNGTLILQSRSSAGTPIVFATGSPSATERMRLDSSGNLGLGVTPNANWGTSAGVNGIYRVMQVGTTAAFGGNQSFNRAYMFSNVYWDGSNYKYLTTGPSPASWYEQSEGAHYWFIAGAGSGGANISQTQAMTLHASGGLSVGSTADPGAGAASISGTSTMSQLAVTATGVANTTIGFNASGGTVQGIVNNAAYVSVRQAYPLVFGTAETERARITSGGYFKAAGNSSYIDLAGAYHEFVASVATGGILRVENKNNTSGNFVFTTLLGSNCDNTNSYHILCATGGLDKFYVYGNGNVVNANNSYGALSDAKMKTDIVDAGSQWSDIKALRFRKFKMKDDPSGLVQLGVVAQEVELTSPGLVDEHADKDAEGNDLGTTTKSVKTSILLMKAAVALQEAMARIETLEAEVAALKGA